MDQKSQMKVMAVGFTILRTDDHPSPRIKYKNHSQKEWATMEKFNTKAERDRRFAHLLDSMNDFIND